MTGMTHLALSVERTSHLELARASLTNALASRDDQMARSRAFETTALAVACLRDHDGEVGVSLGTEAVKMAGQLRSGRVLDRLEPLRRAAGALPTDAAQGLAHRIGELTAV
jgi:hypothetical protein